MNAGG